MSRPFGRGTPSTGIRSLLSALVPDPPDRVFEQELMERDDADRETLYRTLDQFHLTNLLLSRARHLLTRFVLSDMIALRESRRDRPFTFLDIGAGGGDIDRWLARRCERLGIPVRITMLDNDPRIVEYAREACAGYPSIEVVEGSALELDAGGKGSEATGLRYDYLFANHFLHHLPWEEIPGALERFRRSSERLFLVSDLVRSRLSRIGFGLYGLVFLHGSFGRPDGLASILKGFRKEELERITDDLPPGPPVRVFGVAPGRIVIAGGPALPPG